jgi:tetratricopeptide (TPR) repeat protein
MEEKANSAAGLEPSQADPGSLAVQPHLAPARAAWLRQFKDATALHLQGKRTEARDAYLKLVVVPPLNVHLLKLLGRLEQELGQNPLAVRWLELALTLGPDFETLLQLADVHLQQRDFDAARQRLNAALAIEPGAIKAHHQLGLVYSQAGEVDAALAAFSRVLDLEPKHAQALSQRAHLQLTRGALDDAIDGYDRFLKLHPADSVAHYNRGMALHGAGRYGEAAGAFRQAIAANPAFDSALNNLGSTLSQMRDYEAALRAHQACLELVPSNANYHYNTGGVLHELGRFDEAAQAFSQALVQRPDFAAAAFNRGNALREALRLPEAISSFDLALQLQPDNANFHWTKALAALLHGDYASGWLHYELRWDREGGEVRRVFAVPQWTGRQDIFGKTLLVHGEQGLGDMIQFSRYALDVIALGGRVVFGAPPVLHPLLRSMHPSIKCIISNAEHPDFDFHCPVMSLPYAFSTTVTSVPAPCPYFFADRQLQEDWGRKLGPVSRPRVGLVWFGNPKHLHDHRRSLSLETLQPVLDLPLEFHSLQQELRTQDAVALVGRPTIHLHGPSLTDFAQTAALIANLDVIVTVDTSVAHLAGALGKPVFLLVHAVPDFRWLLGRDDSPWYPSVRLFRQTRRDSWTEAIDRMRDALVQRYVVGETAG